ncbi:MAG: hypothetical protein FVQ77_05985 [Cytophagales bacterium]|nr:hypothetical protein [Cytophagales bacterium]
MIRLFIISLIVISCNGNSTQIDKSQIINYQKESASIQSDSLLVGIQDKILQSFVQSLMSKKIEEMEKLSNELEKLFKQKNKNLILYWRSYLQFYKSIYYLKSSEKENAKKEIERGVDWMEEMKKKNSEDYALLTMLKSFSIQFKSGMKAAFISKDVKQNAKTAIAIDSLNLRAYYVYASNDFYTPKKYGGGKEAEKYLLKAISLPDQKIKNIYLPSWGKEEAYEMLIKLYIRNKKLDLAKKYFKKANKLYPDNYTINQLATKLIE